MKTHRYDALRAGLWIGFMLASLSYETRGQSPGYLIYQTTAGVGKEKYTFACDPHYGPGSGFDGRPKADDRFYAQLWWSPSTNVNSSQMRPVPGSLVTYRSGSTAGIINGKTKLEIPGTFGGDQVALQLRFWNHDGGRLQSWDEAVRAQACIGFSPIFTHMLGGVPETGAPVLVSGTLATSLPTYLIPFPTTLGHEPYPGYCVNPAENSAWISGQPVPLQVSDWYGYAWDLSAPWTRVYVDEHPVSLGTSATNEIVLEGLSVGRHLVRVERWVELACCGEPSRVAALGFASTLIHVLPASGLPQVERQPQPAIAAGGSVEFQVEATGPGVLQYQWYRNGEPLTGATQQRLVLTKPGLPNEGYYSARVSTVHGQVSSDAVYLSVIKNEYRSITVSPAALPSEAVPAIVEAELWGGPQPDALSRIGTLSWPFTAAVHALKTVSPQSTAYVQLRGRRAGADAFEALSPLVSVPSAESEVLLGYSAEASHEGLQLSAAPSATRVFHQRLTWWSRGSVSSGPVRHELRKDGIGIPNTVGENLVPDSGVLLVTNDVAAVGALDVGSYRALWSRGSQVWMSAPVKVAAWLDPNPYLLPPAAPGQRPVPVGLWNARPGLYRVESSSNLLDWTQEALVRSLDAPFEVYPAWRGREPHRFFRALVLE